MVGYEEGQGEVLRLKEQGQGVAQEHMEEAKGEFVSLLFQFPNISSLASVDMLTTATATIPR